MNRTVRTWALAVFTLSLLVRLYWVSQAYVTPVSDFAGYDTLAVKWLETGAFGYGYKVAARTPGYPALLATIYATVGHSPITVAVFQAVIGGFTSLLLFLLGVRIGGVRVGIGASILHIFMPTTVLYTAVLASENLASPLLLTALLVLHASDTEGRARRMALSAAGGVICGLLILVRPAGLFFVPGIVLVVLYSFRTHRWYPKAAAAVLGAMLLTLVPWFVRNHYRGMGWYTLATISGYDLYMGNNEKARHGGHIRSAKRPRVLPEKEHDAAYMRDALRWIRGHPKRYAKLCIRRSWTLLGIGPDGTASLYLVPTRENDRLCIVSRKARSDPSVMSPDEKRLFKEHITRNKEFLRNVRLIVAPLLWLGILVAFSHPKKYAIVLFPFLAYAILISLTFSETRARELSDPLLYLPIAALLLGGRGDK